MTQTYYKMPEHLLRATLELIGRATGFRDTTQAEVVQIIDALRNTPVVSEQEQPSVQSAEEQPGGG